MTVAKAARFAVEAHEGQLDKSGLPYILHPARVAATVAAHGPEAQTVAWLHDVVEDTEVTLAEIEAGFGPVIAAAVDAITERKGEETYLAYVARCAQNPLAAIVKKADIADNSSDYRITNLPVAKQTRMLAKFAGGLEVLAAAA
jgi:(p)ppGpp synthase/HD superfamily hydrolase